MDSKPLIELSDVTLRYGGDTIALSRTSLAITAGDFVGACVRAGIGSGRGGVRRGRVSSARLLAARAVFRTGITPPSRYRRDRTGLGRG